MPTPHGPAGWQMCMGLYAGCNGVALLVSPHAFSDNPIWFAIARLGFPQALWAVLLVVYGSASLACLLRGPAHKLAALAAFGIPLWIGLGAGMLAGAADAGFLSAAGLFEIIAGVGCAVCMVQWAR